MNFFLDILACEVQCRGNEDYPESLNRASISVRVKLGRRHATRKDLFLAVWPMRTDAEVVEGTFRTRR
jgi:hypothetical protein